MTIEEDTPGKAGSAASVVRDAEVETDKGTVRLSDVVAEKAAQMNVIAEALEAGANVHLTDQGTFELGEEAKETGEKSDESK